MARFHSRANTRILMLLIRFALAMVRVRPRAVNRQVAQSSTNTHFPVVAPSKARNAPAAWSRL
jgi:hypothetical protein